MSEAERPLPNPEYGIVNLVQHWKQQRAKATLPATLSGMTTQQGITPLTGTLGLEGQTPELSRQPELLVQAAIVIFGDKTKEGQLIQAVTIPWFEIIKELAQDPEFRFKIPWRKLEELIAGRYRQEGYEVTLTPRSGDKGRDVMVQATMPGVGSILIIDEVKQFAPNRIVAAKDVRALLGVLNRDRNVSKGIVTTTSKFSPGIEEEFVSYMPERLQLKDGKELLNWLFGLKS